VRTVAVDRVPLLRPPVDFVRIAVQGAEETAIRGMERLLADSPDAAVSTEFWPYGIQRFGSSERRLLEYYRSLGYEIAVQDPEVPGTSELTDDELLALCPAEDEERHVNLILTRSSGRSRRAAHRGEEAGEAKSRKPKPTKPRRTSPGRGRKHRPKEGSALDRANALVDGGPQRLLAPGPRSGPLRRVAGRLIDRALASHVRHQHEISRATVESANGLAEAVSRIEEKVAGLERAGERAKWAHDRLQPLPVAPELLVRAPTGHQRLGYDTPSGSGGDHSYKSFEDVFRGPEELVRSHQQVYVDLLGAREPVLDVGCGRGELLDLLRWRGLVGRGVDADPGMVARARTKGHDVVRADAVEYLGRQADDSLGAVFAAHVAEHLPYESLLKLLEVAHEKLAPDGLLILETVNPHSLVALRAFWLDLTHRVPIYPQVALTLCRIQGFEKAFVIFPRDTATGRLEDDLREEDSYAVIATKAPGG